MVSLGRPFTGLRCTVIDRTLKKYVWCMYVCIYIYICMYVSGLADVGRQEGVIISSKPAWTEFGHGMPCLQRLATHKSAPANLQEDPFPQRSKARHTQLELFPNQPQNRVQDPATVGDAHVEELRSTKTHREIKEQERALQTSFRI